MFYIWGLEMRNLVLLCAGLAAYVALLVFSQIVLSNGIERTMIAAIISLLPMLPAIFICAVIVRTIRQMDEMQRKLQFEALAMAFAGTALITFGYGFLEGSGLPKVSMFVVWPIMAALWFIGVMIGRIRFR
jgi:CDP-diglyceride synthetase